MLVVNTYWVNLSTLGINQKFYDIISKARTEMARIKWSASSLSHQIEHQLAHLNGQTCNNTINENYFWQANQCLIQGGPDPAIDQSEPKRGIDA